MPKTMLKMTCVLVMAMVVAGGLMAPRPARSDDTVATVNGQAITEAQVLAELKARYGYIAREALIINAVIEQYAKTKGVTVTEDEINAQVARDTADAQAQGATFAQALAQQGLTLGAYRTRLRNTLLLQKTVADEVTDEQVKALYERMPPDQEALKLSYIALGSKEEADKLRADLAANKLTWEQAAKQYNLDPYGRENGTNMDWVPKAGLGEAVVASLQRDGDISQPVEYSGHWTLLRRSAYRPQGRPPFEQVQNDLRQSLVREAAKAKLEALRNVAEIKRLGDYKAPGQ